LKEKINLNKQKMEHQFRVLEAFLKESKINSDSFYNVNFWNQADCIHLLGNYKKELVLELIKYGEGVLGELGQILFNFTFANQEFRITLI
jgi:hypothetical protein